MIPINEFVEEVCKKMGGTLDQLQNERLINILTLALHGCRIEELQTAIIPYNERDNEWFIEKFIITKKAAGLTDKTLKCYLNTLRAIFRKMRKRVTDIQADDIINYLAERDIKDNVTRAAQQHDWRVLSTFFNWMTTDEHILRNPMYRVPKPKDQKLIKSAFTNMELEKLRAACITAWESCVIETLLSTGCRVSELIQLKCEDVRDADECVIVGKGMKERTVYFNARARFAIEKYLSERSDTNPFLFCAGYWNTERERNWSTKEWYKNPKNVAKDGCTDIGTIESHIRRIGKRAGLPDGECYPHKFRRTCATLALRRGMPLVHVSKMLGHEKLATTQIYLDLNDDDLGQAHEKYLG